MRKFISEDDNEQAILQKQEAEPFSFGIVRCDSLPSKREVLADGTGCGDKKECVLPQGIEQSLDADLPSSYCGGIHCGK